MKIVIKTLKDNIRWTENFISDKGKILTKQEKELNLKRIEKFKKAIKILEESERQTTDEQSGSADKQA